MGFTEGLTQGFKEQGELAEGFVHNMMGQTEINIYEEEHSNEIPKELPVTRVFSDLDYKKRPDWIIKKDPKKFNLIMSKCHETYRGSHELHYKKI